MNILRASADLHQINLIFAQSKRGANDVRRQRDARTHIARSRTYITPLAEQRVLAPATPNRRQMQRLRDARGTRETLERRKREASGTSECKLRPFRAASSASAAIDIEIA